MAETTIYMDLETWDAAQKWATPSELNTPMAQLFGMPVVISKFMPNGWFIVDAEGVVVAASENLQGMVGKQGMPVSAWTSQDLFGEELAFLDLAAGIADRTRGAARQRNRVMAQKLEAPQRQQGHQVAHVQALGRRVKPAIQRDRPRADPPPQLRAVRSIGHQTPPGKLFENIHPGDNKGSLGNFNIVFWQSEPSEPIGGHSHPPATPCSAPRSLNQAAFAPKPPL